MPHLSNILAFAGVWAVIVVSPGPDLMVTIRLAISRSRRAALAAVAGISMGTAIWATLAAVGLAVILAQEQWLADVVRWCGAGYLVLLAVRILRHAREPLPDVGPSDGKYSEIVWPSGASAQVSTQMSGQDPQHFRMVTSDEGMTIPHQGLLSAWRTGLFADLSNPKAAVFWSSLFAATIPKGSPHWLSVVIVIVAVVIAGSWYTAAAYLLSVGRILRSYKRAKKWIDYLTGGILTGLAVRLAVKA